MNKYAEHVYVIPEDNRDRQIADGFILHHQVNDTRIQVMPPAGGWAEVRKIFQREYVPLLKKYVKACVVLLIDFDDHVERRMADFKQVIPDEFSDRVFIVGAKDTPETLKTELRRTDGSIRTYEDIGGALASDCHAGTIVKWSHEHLKHNEGMRALLCDAVRPFLFT